MNDDVTISVVMGVYNGERQLDATIDSILGQTFDDFEFIIVDDGSTDNSNDKLIDRAREDRRIHVVRQQNGGLTSALITGSKLARGTFLARQDIGDVSKSTRFQQQLDFLKGHPDVVAVSGGYRRIGPEGEYLGEQCRHMTPRQVTDSFLSVGTGIPHTAAMIRMDAFRRVGGYRKQFRFAQDCDHWYRLCRHGLLAEIDDSLFDWGIDVGGISASNLFRQQRLAQLARQSYDACLKGDDDTSVLQQANSVSWDDNSPVAPTDKSDTAAAAELFIGSQLYSLGDLRCRHYFRRAISRRPFWAKAWAKLMLSYLPNRRFSENV
ncbi:MAG: glycosyltransferase [Planctomycetales bacterium]|nr:glycosyltransferase [Planctomycetales bacterium]